MKRIIVMTDENISEIEKKKIENAARQYCENVIKGKKSDDYTFDSDYNEAIESTYYDPENGYVMFLEAEYNFNAIYQYFQYTKRFVKAYETTANEYYKKLQEAEYYDVFAPNGELIHLNCESILLMVYSAFEAFLRQFTAFIDDKAGILKYPYDDHTTLKYLDYLNYEKNIFVPKKLYREFSEIRLVRNYYAHSLDEIQYKLKRSLETDPYGIMVGGRIVVNAEYIEHIFEVLGRMVKAIETAFERNYPELQ